MQELITSPGYPTLFGLRFLASTLIPLGSEWLPVIGDSLCLAGGILRVRFGRFARSFSPGNLPGTSLWLG